MKKLTIVIVNYNSSDFLVNCLKSIHTETACPSYRTVVVDNDSFDADLSEIKERFPKVHFILNESNVGFSKACNQGLRSFPAENYLLLNPDTLILDSAIDKTLEFLESDPAVGIVGCRVQNPDGSLQLAARREIPKPSTALFRLLRLNSVFPQSRFAQYNVTHFSEHETHPVEAVSGSFLLFRRELLKDIGGLDEEFFLYGEDLDFCYRTTLEGWKVYYFAGAAVTHFKRASSSRTTRAATFHFYDAMRIFYRKHYYTKAGIAQNILVLGAIRGLYWWQRFRQALTGNKTVGSGE